MIEMLQFIGGVMLFGGLVGFMFHTIGYQRGRVDEARGHKLPKWCQETNRREEE